MKSNQIKNSLFGYKSIGVVALLSGIWLNTAIPSFGITIGRSDGLSSAICADSVSVEGGVECYNECEATPVVTVVKNLPRGNNWSSTPTVTETEGCYHGFWVGTWAPTSVPLVRGVTVITASDNCGGGGSDSISVSSNVGSGPAIQTSIDQSSCGDPFMGGFLWGMLVKHCFNSCGVNAAGWTYQEHDAQVDQNGCNDAAPSPIPNPHTLDSNGCTGQDVWALLQGPTKQNPGTYKPAPCTSQFTYTLTVTDPNNNSYDFSMQVVSKNAHTDAHHGVWSRSGNGAEVSCPYTY